MTDGWLNVLKPPGMTSHDVISFLRKTLDLRRIGHAGTLDPGAAGVLPVAVGRTAKFLEYAIAVDKSYRAELLFGIATDTGDATGAMVCRAATGWQYPSAEKIDEAIKKLTGKISQTPPVYSAVKIGGKRAADLARKNKDVALPPRQVTIYRLEKLAENPTEKTLLLDIDCSKGTYIRSLCEDLGKIVGIPATMSFLVRTRVGAFPLAAAQTLEEIGEKKYAALLPAESGLRHLPRYDLPLHRVKPFFNGLPTTEQKIMAPDGTLYTAWAAEKFCGIARYAAKEKAIYPEKIYSQI